MTKRNGLTNDELSSALATLDEWTVVNNKLYRHFQFNDFVEAFAFMTKLALVAEKLEHHPEWTNIYNSVTISLITHDADAISQLDLEFAQACNRYFDNAN